MRTAVAVVLIGAVLGAGSVPEAGATARPCRGWRFDADEPGIGPARERLRNRRIVRCTFGRVAPAQTPKALAVAECESHMDDEALNRGSGASGLFQHLRRYWPGRARALPDRLFPHRPGPFFSQANAWAAAVMVRRDGWGAWSCA